MQTSLPQILVLLETVAMVAIPPQVLRPHSGQSFTHGLFQAAENFIQTELAHEVWK